MHASEIDNAIAQLQAGSAQAPADLTLIALASACTPEQFHRIASAFYAALDDAHLQDSQQNKTFPFQQASCLASLASILAPRLFSGVQGTLQALVSQWPMLNRWILYLKSDFVDQESVDLSFRILAKRCIVDILGICDDSFLRDMFTPVVAFPGIITTLFALWRLETQDPRFSLDADPSTHPTFHTQAILDSWMCTFSERERWDWPEILRPFSGEPHALANTALDRLQQDVARVPVNYDLIIWDIHLITTLSVNEFIRIPLLNQHSMTVITNMLNSMLARYATTDQHSLVAKCISYGYWYIRAYVESTDGLPWIVQVVEAGLLSAMLSSEPWFKHLGGQDSDEWEPLFLLLTRIIPLYSMYSSVLKPISKRLVAIGSTGLPPDLDKAGLLFQSWTMFLAIVHNRVALYNLSVSNETHIESCQNAKCDKSGPPGSFKSCTGCLHVHYCSRECQLYDWKTGGHHQYCRDMQTRRAGGLISRLSKRDVHFIDRIIAQDLVSYRFLIQSAATRLNYNPVVIELDYTDIPTKADIGSTRTASAIMTCDCDLPLTQKWHHMIELAQKSTTQRVLVRALLRGGTSEKVKLQCLPLKRALGDCTPGTDDEPMAEFSETFNVLYSRVGQSPGVVDQAFPEEALRAMRERIDPEGRKV